MNTINNQTNNSDIKTIGDSLVRHTGESSNPHLPYSVIVDDTTVRLHFKENGDLTSRLTDAFNSMLS